VIAGSSQYASNRHQSNNVRDPDVDGKTNGRGGTGNVKSKTELLVRKTFETRDNAEQ
jgi:hypothetical protein